MRTLKLNLRLVTAGAALAAAVLTAACSPSNDSTAQAQDAPSTTDGARGSATAAPSGGGAPASARIVVTADGFAFSQEEIRVRAGQEVEVVLTSEDMAHNFTLDELDVEIEAASGQTTTGRFTPTTPGTYEFYCSIAGHRGAGMEGTLIVEG